MEKKAAPEARNPLTNQRVSRERATGVEPATLCLASIRSSQLSYARVESFLAEGLRGVKVPLRALGSVGLIAGEVHDGVHRAGSS